MAFVGLRRVVRIPEIGKTLGEMLPATAKWLSASQVSPASPCLSVYLGFDGRVMSFDMLGGFFVRPESLRALFGPNLDECRVKVAENCEERGTLEAKEPASKVSSGPSCEFGEFVHGLVPVGEVVSYIYSGPYDKLGDAHMSVDAWIKAQGRNSVWPCWEIYLTDPGQVPNPADWKTEIVWPIR